MIDIAIRAAFDAGQEILKIYNDPNVDFSIEIKDDNSPLTIADKASHNIIIKHLGKTSFPILSEEGKSMDYSIRKTWEKFWLVDPLDGTKEFIKRNGEFTVNIAFIENGKPTMGIIYIPVLNTIYVSKIETGAWKLENVNENCDWHFIQIHGVKLPILSEKKIYTIAGSRSHMSEETQDYLSEIKEKYPEINFISKGSSIKICLVAEGIADEYPRFGPTMEWDTAAGHAIASAAGKNLWLTDFSSELHYNKENLLNPYFIVK